MAKHAKVPVTSRALIQRINRAMRKNEDDRVVKKTRGRKPSVGEFYVLNTRGNWVDFPDVDLVELAKEYEVIQPWEELREGE